MNQQDLTGAKLLKTIIRVFSINYENGKKYKTSAWDGLLTGITTHGLMLIPINPDWGVSNDPLAASFISFPEYRGNDIEFEILAET